MDQNGAKSGPGAVPEPKDSPNEPKAVQKVAEKDHRRLRQAKGDREHDTSTPKKQHREPASQTASQPARQHRWIDEWMTAAIWDRARVLLRRSACSITVGKLFKIFEITEIYEKLMKINEKERKSYENQ